MAVLHLPLGFRHLTSARSSVTEWTALHGDRRAPSATCHLEHDLGNVARLWLFGRRLG
jgi:hypothetical protein